MVSYGCCQSAQYSSSFIISKNLTQNIKGRVGTVVIDQHTRRDVLSGWMQPSFCLLLKTVIPAQYIY
jgi:hypothetical protein